MNYKEVNNLPRLSNLLHLKVGVQKVIYFLVYN